MRVLPLEVYGVKELPFIFFPYRKCFFFSCVNLKRKISPKLSINL